MTTYFNIQNAFRRHVDVPGKIVNSSHNLCRLMHFDIGIKMDWGFSVTFTQTTHSPHLEHLQILKRNPFEKEHGSLIYTLTQGWRQISWDKTNTAWERGIWVRSFLKRHGRTYTPFHSADDTLFQCKVLHHLHYWGNKAAWILPTSEPGCSYSR